ncbi:hypothetical protein [Bacillus thuringiensis]|uniref:hypothetical protein n=1 Tax=Bacillus thuringiensis TaxID=1428 RepID=UPI0021D65166|nr:hypothetical protein [Bacillus thuringiensis]MCU7667149.1 hypothetical protein [Bacillus thuringiensis]
MSRRSSILLVGLCYGIFISIITQLICHLPIMSIIFGLIAGSVLIITLALFAGASESEKNTMDYIPDK